MIFKNCFYFFLIFLLASCASQVAPTGGVKDLQPPVVVKSNPENLTTGFHSQKISLQFNEYVQLNDATTQIFFSPALTGNAVYKLRGKTVLIELPDSLKANTTYTINFGSSIKDITEGNILLNYQYVFSTGNSIDSMRIEGKVQNALGGKKKPNLLVMLYRDAKDDSVVAKQRPDYNARTDSAGLFTISHISAGNYKLFALDDQNFNFLYDQPGESIAYVESPISINDTSGNYQLTLFKSDLEKQFLLNAYSRQPGKATFVFAKRTSLLNVRAFNDSLHGVLEYNIGHDTCSYWVNDLKSDSIGFEISDHDFKDTVRVRMKTPETKQKVSSSSQKFSISIAAAGRAGTQVNAGDPLLLDFSLPVVFRNEKRKIILQKDSIEIDSNVKTAFVTDSISGKKRAMISNKFLKNTNYTLLIPDSAFTDLFGNENDTVKINLHTYDEEELGNLNLKISFSDSLSQSNYFYEFRSANGAMLAKETLPAKTKLLVFKSLAPGNYSLKIVEDKNNNRQWDTGNYWQHLQPEKIFNFSGAITIRPNWDVDVQMRVENK